MLETCEIRLHKTRQKLLFGKQAIFLLAARTRFSGRVKDAETTSFFCCELRVLGALRHVMSDISIYARGKGSVVVSLLVLYLYFAKSFLPFHRD